MNAARSKGTTRVGKIGLLASIPLGFQHLFAMFSATVLVPLLTGLDPAVALFTSGTGTLLFQIITKGQVPAYLGSSFAFYQSVHREPRRVTACPTLWAAAWLWGCYTQLWFYHLKIGVDWIDRFLPQL